MHHKNNGIDKTLPLLLNFFLLNMKNLLALKSLDSFGGDTYLRTNSVQLFFRIERFKNTVKSTLDSDTQTLLQGCKKK